MEHLETRNTLRAINSQIDGRASEFLSRLHLQRGVGRMLFLLALTFVFFAVLNPRVFLNPLNMQNIAVSTAEVGVLAIAMMVAMLTGGIDLSLVSIANLTAISVSVAFTQIAATHPQLAESLGPLMLLAAPLVGMLAGAVNGILIGVLGVTPILATLGTMQILNGIALVWTGGQTLYGAPEVFGAWGTATVLGVPVLFLSLLGVAVVVALIVSKTPLGMKIQFQGSNPVAAKYSGIRPRSVLISTYMLTGALAGVAGAMFIARNPSASADYGLSYTLLVIVIAVLGGTNPSGGFATVAGVVLAAMTLQTLASGFSALRLSAYEYSIAQGVILILVLVLDQMKPRKRRLRLRGEQAMNLP